MKEKILLDKEDWRITSGKLYKIKDKNAKTIPFVPNDHQLQLYYNIHNRNIIPKARQLGFSTFIDVLGLDYALFHRNANVGIIAHDKESVKKIFQDKVKFARDHLPSRLKDQYQVKTDSANELQFSLDGKSWSSIKVGLSFRSGTYQFLHISEFGKICAKYPAKADEIVTGAIEAVPKDGLIFIESTAEGDDGYFYDWTMDAQEIQESNREPNELEYKLHFFPRYNEPTYRLSDESVIIPQDKQKYFLTLKKDYGIELDHKQMRWYVVKERANKDKMKREYPSVLKECFEVSIEGSYYASYLLTATSQQRIGTVLYDHMLPVSVSFDLGGPKGGDFFALWFCQQLGNEIRLIDYWEGNAELKYIGATVLPGLGYEYDQLYIPWDGFVTQMSDGNIRAGILEEQGYTLTKVPKGLVSSRIETTKQILPRCHFDQERCHTGLRRLRNYKKRRNTSLGRFMEEPEHNISSHGSDSFGYLCEMINAQPKKQLEQRPPGLNISGLGNRKRVSFSGLRHDVR